jgi:hypothetical protein
VSDQIPRKDERSAYFKAMAYWLIANCLAAVLLTQRPQIEDTYWFWFFCIPGVMFLRAAYRWVLALR